MTDPPDPLADIARIGAGHDRVLSTGTFLDSLRFRFHLAEHFDVDANQVGRRSSANTGSRRCFSGRAPALPACRSLSLPASAAKRSIACARKSRESVRFANITIIEGNDASQFGIGIVSARIAEMVLRDERAVIPVGSFHERFGVTLSLPSVVGQNGVVRSLEPEMSPRRSRRCRRARPI